MEVILREDIQHLGTVGDIVRVRPGYARNYLLPRGMATVADKRNLRALEHEKRVVDEKRRRLRTEAEQLEATLASTNIVIQARAGDEGKLYGSVTALDIEQALAERGIRLDRRRIRIDEPFRTLGTYSVQVLLAVGICATLSVVVKSIDT